MVTSVVTTSGNTTCMDFSTNQWHGYVGGNTPYGLCAIPRRVYSSPILQSSSKAWTRSSWRGAGVR